MQVAKGHILKIIVLIIIISSVFYYYNHKYNDKEKTSPGEPAKPGEYSEPGNYVNMTPMKHDIIKQIITDMSVFFIIFFLIEVVGRHESFFDWDDFLNFKNFREFRLSILGQSMITCIGYLVYYQIIEPYFANIIPKF